MKILTAMSGGVDSSVCALLLKNAGYNAIGATMKLFDNGDTANIADSGRVCCTLDDALDARDVCFALGMPHYVFNFTDDFKRDVIDYFNESYLRGETPNPCIECNRKLKFGKLLSRAYELDCEKIATGHYARIEKSGGRFLLKKAVDRRKDQSYVLYTMSQTELSHTLFPLGGLSKPEVRGIAEEHGLINAKKHESQDICFVPDGDYAGFIERYTGRVSTPGDFLNTAGEKLGTHRGVIHYTKGQRKGLLALGKPYYVTNIDPEHNTVTLGGETDLYTNRVRLRNINLIAADSITAPLKLFAKTRYNQTEQPCEAVQTGDREITIVFEKPQKSVTPGQSCVMYDGETVIGGGIIC
jgi:tRNA-specific 2-thiouridylase